MRSESSILRTRTDAGLKSAPLMMCERAMTAPPSASAAGVPVTARFQGGVPGAAAAPVPDTLPAFVVIKERIRPGRIPQKLSRKRAEASACGRAGIAAPGFSQNRHDRALTRRLQTEGFPHGQADA